MNDGNAPESGAGDAETAADSETEKSAADIERNLGEQPLTRLMLERGLKSHDLVSASTEQITHKMVARACKGRRLTRNVQVKILNAMNRATGGKHAMAELFNY